MAATPRPPIPVTILSGFLGAGKTSVLKHILSHAHELPSHGSDGTNAKPARIAVIVNDMGEINIDAEMIRAHTHALTRPGADAAGDAGHIAQEVVELSNGCICCTRREDLVQEIARVCTAAHSDADGPFAGVDYIVIESSGISEPMPVAEAFTFDDIRSLARVDTCVSVVDAANFEAALSSADRLRDKGMAVHDTDERNIVDLLIDQVEFADVVLLNKADLVDAPTLSRTRALIQHLNRHAVVLDTTHGRVAPSSIINTSLFSLERAAEAPGWLAELRGSHIPETIEYGITSFVFRYRRPFHPSRLDALMRAGAHVPLEHAAAMRSVVRSKGFFWLACAGGWEDSCLWAHAGRIVQFTVGREWWATSDEGDWEVTPAQRAAIMRDWDDVWGDRRQELVLIGVSMNVDAVRAALLWAALSDDEMAAGREAWETYEDPLDFIMEEVDEDEAVTEEREQQQQTITPHVHGVHCDHAHGHDHTHDRLPSQGRTIIAMGADGRLRVRAHVEAEAEVPSQHEHSHGAEHEDEDNVFVRRIVREA